MDYQKLNNLGYELYEYWKRLHGLYLDSVVGFSLVHQKISKDQSFIREWIEDSEIASESFQDTCQFSYDEIFSNSFCASGIHEATQGEVKNRNRPGGANFILLGQLCVVGFFDYWNEYLRKEYAIAKELLDPNEKDENNINKILAKNVSDDFWGDMGYLRNSIVHNRGYGSSKIKKCKLIKWFKQGDEINLVPEMMRQIFLAVLRWRNKILGESIPKSRGITIPRS